MVIYLDESGDLGFGGGGSDHFVITFMAVSDPAFVKRIVRKAKTRYKLPANYEIKGSATTARVKKYLLRELSQLDIEIHSIIMKKANVFPRLRKDPNILYNYVLCLVLAPYLTRQQSVSIVVDKRIVSVESGLKLDDYLKYKVWYENRADVDIHIHHEDSKWALGIQAVDVISYSIFRKYEAGDMKYYSLIGRRVREERKLFWQ